MAKLVVLENGHGDKIKSHSTEQSSVHW